MDLFLELEGPYLVIGTFILAITIFVTTRDFVPRVAFKRGIISVLMGLATLIAIHYINTTSRMATVEQLFADKQTVICENKMQRTISQSVLIRPNTGWRIENHLFKNDDYIRDFHTSRCVDWIGSEPQIEKEVEEINKAKAKKNSLPLKEGVSADIQAPAVDKEISN